MNDEIKYEIEKAIEQAYRRGYSHGFSFGCVCDPHEMNKIKNELIEWKSDLSKMTGAPGSGYEKNEMKWTTVQK